MMSPELPIQADPAVSATGSPCGRQSPAPTRAALSRLRATHALSPSGWRDAMNVCGFIPDAAQWRAYWRHILLLGGALFLAAGVIFFIAWNWADMHRFGKMALTGAAVAATGAGALLRGPDSFPGRVLLLCCGISVGPMLAVFGQTYQTGAELWELFRVWTVVLFALALAGKQAALWFVTWLCANIFVMLWLGSALNEPLETLGMFSLLPECVLALALAVAAWEVAARRSPAGNTPAGRAAPLQGWLRPRWLPRLLFFDLTVRLTVYICLYILRPYGLHLPVLFLPHAVLLFLAPALAGASWYWHRRRTPDLFMPACLVGAGCVIFVAILLKAEFLFRSDLVSALFIWGLLIVGLTAGAGKILLVLQRRMEQDGEKGGAPVRANMTTSFFAPSLPVPSWEALWTHLKGAGHVGADTPLPVPEPVPASPWYVRAMLALGGWISALLFLVFLGMFLFMTLNIDSGHGAALFVISWAPLVAAYVCFKAQGILLRHFGLSLAIAGSAAACVGMAWHINSWMATPFLCAALLICLSFAMNSAPYRFFAALAVVQLVPVGIAALFFAEPQIPHALGSSGSAWYWAAVAEPQIPHALGSSGSAWYWAAVFVMAAWWACVSAGLAAARLHGENRLSPAAWRILEPALFGAYGGMMLFLIASLSAGTDIWIWRNLPPIVVILFSNSFSGGLGAAAGLVVLVHHLMRDRGTGAQRGAVACAALALPLGWFLPGAALAAFGLAMSRYSHNHVMQGLTVFFLFAYMVCYYYFLGVALLYKSLLLTVTGAVLLGLAFVLGRSAGKQPGGVLHA